MFNPNCECCGKETNGEFGDVDGAIVCFQCIETDPEVMAAVDQMEEREAQAQGDQE